MSTATATPPTRGEGPTRGPTGRAPRMFSADLGAAPWPARGLFFSVLAHLLFVLATMMVPWNYWMPSGVRLVTMQTQMREQELLLPDLQPMGRRSEAAPAPGSGQGEPKPRGGEPSAAAKAVRGVVVPGPQIIVSNPPHPDNFRQTILQPDLPRPPKLPTPLPVPPMVSIAPSQPVLAPQPQPVPQPEPAPEPPPAKPVVVLPLSLPQQLPKIEVPRLPLPAASTQEVPLNAVSRAPVPAALPKLARPPVALADEPANAAHNILVVDAVPVPNAKPTEIPPGELHGAFTVSPSGPYSSPASTGAGGGTAPQGAPGVGSATGTGTSPYAGTGTGLGTGEGTAASAGSGTGTGIGHGTGAGLAQGTGLGSGPGSAAGTGTGNGAGSGSSAGAGSGVGTSAGTGTGTGASPFPGITIQGGSNSASSGRTHAGVPANAKPQTSYGFTIVANAASGGGFKDYGIFTDRASYTVYLDMADAGVRASWALQYAPDTSSGNSSDPPVPVLGTLEPPYAITKALPLLTSEAARRSQGSTVVVFGVINRNGQWERLRIMQTPDSNLNRLVLDALAKWIFEPAKMYGRAVPVKCLLGVPVNSLPIQ